MGRRKRMERGQAEQKSRCASNRLKLLRALGLWLGGIEDSGDGWPLNETIFPGLAKRGLER